MNIHLFCYFNNSLAINYTWKCLEPSAIPGTEKALSKCVGCEHTGIVHVPSDDVLTPMARNLVKGENTVLVSSGMLVLPEPLPACDE